MDCYIVRRVQTCLDCLSEHLMGFASLLANLVSAFDAVEMCFAINLNELCLENSALWSKTEMIDDEVSECPMSIVENPHS